MATNVIKLLTITNSYFIYSCSLLFNITTNYFYSPKFDYLDLDLIKLFSSLINLKLINNKLWADFRGNFFVNERVFSRAKCADQRAMCKHASQSKCFQNFKQKLSLFLFVPLTNISSCGSCCANLFIYLSLSFWWNIFNLYLLSSLAWSRQL